jgi:hypothetical protein
VGHEFVECDVAHESSSATRSGATSLPSAQATGDAGMPTRSRPTGTHKTTSTGHTKVVLYMTSSGPCSHTTCLLA